MNCVRNCVDGFDLITEILVRVAIFPLSSQKVPVSGKRRTTWGEAASERHIFWCAQNMVLLITLTHSPTSPHNPFKGTGWVLCSFLFLTHLVAVTNQIGTCVFLPDHWGYCVCVCVLHFILRENKRIGRKIVLYHFCIKDKRRTFHALPISFLGTWESLWNLLYVCQVSTGLYTCTLTHLSM